MIDTDGNANRGYRPTKYASRLQGGGQNRTLRRIEGAGPPDRRARADYRRGSAGFSMGREAQVTQGGDYVSLWPPSDPFFFDVQGTLNNFQFTGEGFSSPTKTFAASCWKYQLCSGAERGWPMGPTLIPANAAGRTGSKWSGGARPNKSIPCRRGDAAYLAETGGRCPLRLVFAHALEHTWIILRRNKAGGRELLPDILRYAHAPRVLPEQWRHSRTTSPMLLGILTNGR